MNAARTAPCRWCSRCAACRSARPGMTQPGSPYGRSLLVDSISSSRLYFATRSPRAGAPALSWPQPAPQWSPGGGGHRPGDRDGGAEQRVGAQPGLVVGSVQLDQRQVNVLQIRPPPGGEQLGDLAVYRVDRPAHPQPPEALRVPIPELHSLTAAGGRARGHRASTDDTVTRRDPHRDGRPPTGVKNLHGPDAGDLDSSHLQNPRSQSRQQQHGIRPPRPNPHRSVQTAGRRRRPVFQGRTLASHRMPIRTRRHGGDTLARMAVPWRDQLDSASRARRIDPTLVPLRGP